MRRPEECLHNTQISRALREHHWFWNEIIVLSQVTISETVGNRNINLKLQEVDGYYEAPGVRDSRFFPGSESFVLFHCIAKHLCKPEGG